MFSRERSNCRAIGIAGLLAVSAALCTVATSPVHAADYPLDGASPQAVAKVVSGKLTVASAAWWGFDSKDATTCLQAAINSGAPAVIVPYVGADWIVTPIRLRSNLTLLFEPGVVVLAKKGAFKGKGDSLFSVTDAENVTLRGYGATLRMRKKDYQSDAYAKAEWRMTLDLIGCRRVRIEGLRLESSGGDGIYLGASSKQPYCADVTIRDVVCHDHHRQGISVIGAVNLLIENCVLSGTSGTAPQAGIDFEPNRSREKLVNCVMRNCVFADNAGAGVLVYAKNLTRQSDPISILVEDCYIRSGKDVGFGVGAVTDNGPAGSITFKNCTVENTAKGGIFVYDKSADRARVRFVNCRWKDVGAPKGSGAKATGRSRTPLLLTLMRPKLTKKNGEIDFVDCVVYDRLARPVLAATDGDTKLGVHDLTGRIFVHNPHGARTDFRCQSSDVNVKLVEIRK